MKKFKIFTILFIFILIICGFKTVFAATGSVIINGTNQVTPGQQNTLTLKISSDEAMGVIDGYLSFDSNIELIEVSSSYNGWTATYNESTGKFNSFNATGTKNGDVLKITYKLKENSSQGTINIKNIELTTISYKTVTASDVSKTISKVSNSIPVKTESPAPVASSQPSPSPIPAGSKLPQTGISETIVTVIAVVAIISLALFMKVHYYRGI